MMRLLLQICVSGVLVAATGCSPGKLCPDNAECPKGAKCWCDDQGRLVQAERDDNGDQRPDRIRYERDEAGRVTKVKTDWDKNGSVERQLEYTYDAEGRRVHYEGWLFKCAGERFRWSCDFDEPCPAPYDACAPCRKTYEVEKEDGSREPVGRVPGL